MQEGVLAIKGSEAGAVVSLVKIPEATIELMVCLGGGGVEFEAGDKIV